MPELTDEERERIAIQVEEYEPDYAQALYDKAIKDAERDSPATSGDK